MNKSEEERKCLGIVWIQCPTSIGKRNIGFDDQAEIDVGHGKEGVDERVEYYGPVKVEGSEAQATHTRPQLLGSNWLGEGPIDPCDVCVQALL